MKNKIARLKKITIIKLNPPKIIENRVFYSFSKNSLLNENGFFIEIKNIKMPEEIYEELLMPYLSICITFAVLKNITIILPYKISNNQINLWNDIINSTAKNVFKNKNGIKLINGDIPIRSKKTKGEKTGLFFGGGAESLLVFAKLVDKNITPILLSFDGPNWSGCDTNNPHKFELENKLLKEFNISNIRIKTSFFELIYTPDDDWREYLDHDIWGIIVSSLHLPFMVTVVLSFAEELDISNFLIGLEHSNNLAPNIYCFSNKSIEKLKKLSNDITFERELEELNKIDIIRELHINYPEIAKYQYSCLKNKFERWCLSCEKCFRIWLGLTIYNIDITTVGMNPKTIIKNMPKMIYETRKEMKSGKAIQKDYEEYFYEAKRLGHFEVLLFEEQIKSNLWIFSMIKIASKIKRKIIAMFATIVHNFS